MSKLELERVAEDFLRSTDSVYSECERGISTLDRVIVSVADALASVTRAALVPTLYAYWERFFRMVFSEYVRCIGATSIPAERFCDSLLKFRLKGELTAMLSLTKATHTNDLVARSTPEEARAHFKRLHEFFALPLSFANPTEWVNTESNVSYQVLERNCTNLGLKVEDIKSHLAPANVHIFRKLNEFVGNRNAIAHGENIGPLSQDAWEEQRLFVLQLMNAVQLSLYDSMREPLKVLRP